MAQPALSDTRRVSAVLVTWNSARFLPRCLEGIAGQTHRPIELIVVDNASADDSLAIVRRSRPDAVIIQNQTNAGFARAVNQAIHVANGELVLLVNPDAFLAPDYVARLIAALDAAGETFGSATGKLLRGEGPEIAPTNVIDSRGIRMTKSGRHLDIEQGSVEAIGGSELGVRSWGFGDSQPPTPNPQPVGPGLTTEHRALSTEVFGVSGAAAIYRKSFIDDVSIGGEFLDEDFFSYREDADVAWRGRLMGWRALCADDAVAWHVRTVTPEKRRSLDASVNMHSVKNRFLLRIKNESLWLALRHAPFELPRDLVALGAVLTIERSSLPALAWLWRNRRRVLAKRREVQRRRRVHDRELARWFT
jgi:GT2 family glycosyltransferase